MAYWDKTEKEIDFDICNNGGGWGARGNVDRYNGKYRGTSCSPDIVNMTFGNPDHWANAFEHGIEYSIMQTDEDVDRVIALFASAAAQGYESPVDIESEVYRQAGVNPENFNDVDKERIQSAVNKLWGIE